MGPRLREDTGEGARIGGGGVWWRRGTLPMGGGRAGWVPASARTRRGGMGGEGLGLASAGGVARGGRGGEGDCSFDSF